MQKILKVAAIASLFASMGAWAHHPTAEILDPEVYEMIDENVADSPHADMDFDDMGAASTGNGNGSN